ncbi:MAG: hypothetical protein MR992_11320 [Lachnospiraceae bacterium]|nr:hypothetical protein [Lachnospiraceae bacterium]MDD7628304.1 hypothetical protein [Lachnospiraceae bacterium]MDY4118293.1 hypothetical protein [Lachnospiraceae bacterium]
MLANYIRNGRFFDSDNARMNLWLMLAAVAIILYFLNLIDAYSRIVFFCLQ